MEKNKLRMCYIAPNICALIGSEFAAQLISLVGSIKILANMPSCNAQVIGATKKIPNTFIIQQANPHYGILIQTEIIRLCPSHLQAKALRLLAAKLVLCARVDAHQHNCDNSTGKKYREEIIKKLEKEQEPPPPKPPRPLPVPDNKPKKKEVVNVIVK